MSATILPLPPGRVSVTARVVDLARGPRPDQDCVRELLGVARGRVGPLTAALPAVRRRLAEDPVACRRACELLGAAHRAAAAHPVNHRRA